MDTSTKALWDTMATASRSHNETNDCTVKALTAATGLDYDTCHAALAKFGRKPRKGCVFHMVGKRAAQYLGWKMETVSKHELRAKTITTAERDPVLRNGRWVLQVSRHVAACVDGKVIDWTQGRRHRLQCAYRFTKMEGTPECDIVKPAAPKTRRKALPKGSAKWRRFEKYTKQDNFELF